MKKLPLFYYPTTWIWIDDDLTLLNAMTKVFGQKNQIKSFQSATECLQLIKNYQSPLLKYNFLKANKEDESFGILQHNPMDFDISSIVNISHDVNRKNEITVAVIDYKMPEMDGFEFSNMIRDIPIKKILLTGNSEENKAIQGLNDTLIHRFVQKGEPDMLSKLSHYLQKLSVEYFENITAPLLSYLEIEARLPLSDPVFIDFFETFCAENSIKEYYLIDNRGSFLCVDCYDNHICLVVHSERSIKAFLSLHEDQFSLAKENLHLIKNFQIIPFFGVGKEGWQIPLENWSEHFYVSQMIEGREKYYWTKVVIKEEAVVCI